MHAPHTMIVIIVVYCQPNAQGKMNNKREKITTTESHVTLDSTYCSRYGNLNNWKKWVNKCARGGVKRQIIEWMKTKMKWRNKKTIRHAMFLWGIYMLNAYVIFKILLWISNVFFCSFGFISDRIAWATPQCLYSYICQIIIIIVFLSLPLTKRMEKNTNFAFVATETQF